MMKTETIEKEDLSTIGSRIRKIRLDSRADQDTFANRVGLTRHSISRIEAGKQEVSAKLLVRLSDEFSISPGWILGRSSDDPEDLMEELDRLRLQNEALEKEIELQKQLIESLNRERIIRDEHLRTLEDVRLNLKKLTEG